MSKIGDATDRVLSHSSYPESSELLATRPSKQKVKNWTENLLNSFDANDSVTPEEEEGLLEILELYDRSEPLLEEYTDELGVQGLDDCSPTEVLFLITIRELQREFASKTSLNTHKFEILREQRYDVNVASDTTSADLTRAELRERAKKSASEDVRIIQSRRETSEYSRSEEIKKYVKARAGGICEGCGSKAPFKNNRGKPYLQAHHVEELSSGGADSLDNVIALCPNCHYRVHHGQDGEEYNKELMATLDGIET